MISTVPVNHYIILILKSYFLFFAIYTTYSPISTQSERIEAELLHFGGNLLCGNLIVLLGCGNVPEIGSINTHRNKIFQTFLHEENEKE